MNSPKPKAAAATPSASDRLSTLKKAVATRRDTRIGKLQSLGSYTP